MPIFFLRKLSLHKTTQNLPVTASKGASINETLTAIFKKAIAQIEKVRRCKVLSITADFLIDYQDQVWLLWMDDAKYVTGENAKDLTRLGVRSEPDMRASWLNGDPQKPFPSVAEQKAASLEKSAKAPKTSPIKASRRRRMSKTTAKVSNELMGAMAARVENDGETRRSEMR